MCLPNKLPSPTLSTVQNHNHATLYWGCGGCSSERVKSGDKRTEIISGKFDFICWGGGGGGINKSGGDVFNGRWTFCFGCRYRAPCVFTCRSRRDVIESSSAELSISPEDKAVMYVYAGRVPGILKGFKSLTSLLSYRRRM